MTDEKSRREFITGKAAVERIREGIELSQPSSAPSSGPTMRLTQRAMACDFSVIMNAGIPKRQVNDASDALDLVTNLEHQMSVYRQESEISKLNRRAAEEPVHVEHELFRLLVECQHINAATDFSFDPTSGPLVALWRECRDQVRIPTQNEIDERLKIVGLPQHVRFNPDDETVQYDLPGVELNLGGIGKGHALDREANLLLDRGVDACLLHGGHSSLRAWGGHHGLGGWPVGLGNPLFTSQRLGTIMLRDRAMSTSGSNIQYFSYRGRRYGHILDPRTGWPVETMLSATVFADTAANADALSTAFYVLGVEKAAACCDNLPGVSAILFPLPKSGRKLHPVVIGIPKDDMFWDLSQIVA